MSEVVLKLENNGTKEKRATMMLNDILIWFVKILNYKGDKYNSAIPN